MRTAHDVGIDEAGRGPILGPLVIASVTTPRKDKWMQQHGVTDSKALTANKRQDLFDEILDRYEAHAVYVSSYQIDEAISSSRSSLTTLEIDVMEDLISIAKGHTIVDAPTSKNPFDESVTYEHGADEQYRCVGAASIIAKHLRDKAVERIAQHHKEVLGSGYPSDPVTQEFLKTASLTEPFLRMTWEPVKEERKHRSQSTLPLNE